eukprot:8378906-Alexandrium_andersonii.AAC.1
MGPANRATPFNVAKVFTVSHRHVEHFRCTSTPAGSRHGGSFNAGGRPCVGMTDHSCCSAG